MKIVDGFTIEDPVSGLRITAHEGEHLNKLTIERIGEPICSNRDFFFDKEGGFDGTGSSCGPSEERR